jgi:NAD+ diphosphatase
MPLDRDERVRRDTALVARLKEDPRSRVLAVWRHRHLVIDAGGGPEPVWHRGEAAARALAEARAWALLGMDGETAHFVADLSHLESPAAAGLVPDGGDFVDLRAVGPLLARDQGAMMAYARGLMFWHGRTRFCSACGSRTESVHGGHVRRCANPECGIDHFPRTDPAVIVLVTHGEACLLGRQRAWPAGMHSTLAGFVEPGESLEEAVRREVFEEAGVRLGPPVYQSSQPWPFPASIMLGFRAEAESRDLRVDTDEIERAAWYERAALLESPEDERFRLPRRDSIARRLIDDWLYRRVPD